jgi:hypothetical protein
MTDFTFEIVGLCVCVFFAFSGECSVSDWLQIVVSNFSLLCFDVNQILLMLGAFLMNCFIFLHLVSSSFISTTTRSRRSE